MSIKKIPVLKRNEYIKEFETVVKQEIALHNKKVQETDNQLNDYRKNMAAEKEAVRRRINELEQYCANLRVHFDESQKIEDRFSHINKKFGEFYEFRKEAVKLFDDLLKESQKMVEHEDLNTIMNHFTKLIQKCLEEMQGLKQECDHKCDQFRKELLAKLEKQEKQQQFFECRLDKIDDNIEDITENLKKCTYNAEWITKDAKRRQKALFVIEKKFEYLDERIRRLQEKQK